jgi:plastocyanin
MRASPTALAVLAATTLVATITTAAPAASAARSHTIVIDAMQFAPSALTVKAGDRVVWVNRDLVPHTATAADMAFESGRIAPGASWSVVATKPGRHDYDCRYHPTMKATLVVEPR